MTNHTMRRFFTNQPLAPDTQVQLCEQSYHHWVRVLRAKVGQNAILFNGKGGEYQAKLIEITKKSATVQLNRHNPINRDNAYHVTIAIVMSKGDRMDYVLQKSTEMGASQFQLLTSDNCEVKLKGERLEKKLKNWQGVVISACEQSGLNIIPSISPPIPVAEFITQNELGLKRVLAPTKSGELNMPFTATSSEKITLLIGAEGGLSHEEVNEARLCGFEPWCLGERILRTETAPVAALSMLHSWYIR